MAVSGLSGGLSTLEQRNQEATCYVGGLDDKVTDDVIWELFLQAGPVNNVHLPKDRVTMRHQGFGFVEFVDIPSADYACKVLNMIKLHGRLIRVNMASSDKQVNDIGANLFIGNLDSEVDEKLLFDTFSAFGVVVQTPKVMRDPDTGVSKGFGFVNFDSFDASDAAIAAMNGQYLANRTIHIQYAYKKDANGERHGTAAERLLASQNRPAEASGSTRPNTMFSDGGAGSNMPPPPPMGSFMQPPQVPQFGQFAPPAPLAGGVSVPMFGNQPNVPMPPPPPPNFGGMAPPPNFFPSQQQMQFRPSGGMAGMMPPPPPTMMQGSSIMGLPPSVMPVGAMMPPPQPPQ